jgi:hypothetical protein
MPAIAPIESPDADFDFSDELVGSAVPVAASDSAEDGTLEGSVCVASGEAAAEVVVGGATSCDDLLAR